VEYSQIHLTDFGDACRWVEGERADYYLDGPEYISWTFRNSIIWNREKGMYVDYIDSDEGHFWTSPADEDPFALPLTHHDSSILQLLTALDEVGVATEDGLRVVASIWRSVGMTDDFHWSQLQEVNQRTVEGLEPSDIPDGVRRAVIERWLFPLYSLDLSPRKVKKEELERQRKLEEESFYRDLV